LWSFVAQKIIGGGGKLMEGGGGGGGVRQEIGAGIPHEL